MNLNALNIDLNHINGSDIPLTDFNSRNPIKCADDNCQVCKFVAEHMDIAVRGMTVADIENGSSKMSFCNSQAWKDAQKNDANLKRTYAQLMSGTRPGKKEKHLRDVRRYLQIATISDSGLLIHRKPNAYGRDYELIIVPQNLAAGLISALHVRLGHPTKTAFKKLWDRHFFAIYADDHIDNCTKSCFLCSSLQKLPSELFTQSSTPLPAKIGVSYSADVISRENQKILILFDQFSSFVTGQIISDEKQESLQQGLIQLSMPFKHIEGCVIRVDNASGFVSLKNDELLRSVGITLDFGRIKNKNQNPTVDKIIQELENEIKRLAPNGGRISSATLAIALSNTNYKIRLTGLSANEVMMKRDHVTNEPLSFDDDKLSELRYNNRVQNHQYSELSKSTGSSPAIETVVEIGDIVHVKNEGSKHRIRDFYLVTYVNRDTSNAHIQKFINDQFRGKKYVVKFSEIFLAQISPHRDSRISTNESDDEIELYKETFHNQELNNEHISLGPMNEPEVPPRRSNRNRNPPNRLATSEIETVLA